MAIESFPTGEVITCDHCGGAFTAGSTEPCPGRYQGRGIQLHQPVDPRDYSHHPSPEREVTFAEAERMRDLKSEVEGGIFHAFGLGAPPADDAARAAAELVARLTALHPDRVERVLVLSRVTAAVIEARDALVTELLEGLTGWGHYARHCAACGAKWPDARREPGHSWRGNGPSTANVEALATLTGLSAQAIRARAKKVSVRLLADAEAAYAALHAEVEV